MACDILPRTTPRPPPFPSPINTDTASSHTHGSINCSLLRPIPPDSSVMDDYRKGYHQPQSYQHQRSSIPLTGTAGIMPHHYQSDEDQQQYTYGRTNQYAIPQHSFPQNYPHSQILASCGHNPPDASVLAPPYSSPHTLFAQPSHHASILASPPSSSALSYQCHPHVLSQPRFPAPHRYYPLHEPCWEIEIEAQESCNEHTALSEPIHPPLEGFPDVREFDLLMKSYVEDLSVKKQDKALIHSKRARNIKIVLADPKDTAIESAQFRFWVKKMFKLEPCDNRTPLARRMICHEGKPVAIREKLFKILTRAHQQCQHGGRDKTSAQVRRIYSWVPKELISRFVKICPTCQVRRGGPRLTPPASCRTSPKPEHHQLNQPPYLLSPPDSRRESVIGRPGMPLPSRSDMPLHTTMPATPSWSPIAHHTTPSSPYHHAHMHPLASTGGTWNSFPRPLAGPSENGHGCNMSGGSGSSSTSSTSSSSTNGPGGLPTMSMHPSHMEYHSSYEESHGMPASHF